MTVETEQTVSLETLEAVMAAFNAHDLDAIMEFFAEDCTFDTSRGPEPWGQRLAGKDAVREGLAARFAGIPDVQYDADAHFVSGNRAASAWLVHGTTTDGTEVRARGCDLWEFRGQLIVRKDSYWKTVDPA